MSPYHANEEVIEVLNELFAEEVEAALRYLHLSVTIKGLDRLLIRGELLEGLRETLEHSQTIADKIIQFGGIPCLDIKLQLPPEKSSAKEAIHNALAFEQAALDAYREALERVGDADVALEEFLRAQISVESEHVAGLSLLLEE